MESSNFALLDTSLGFNLNLSLCDPISTGSELRDPSNTRTFNLETRKEENQNGELLAKELNRMSTENKKLTQMLTKMCENYSNLQAELMGFINRIPKPETDDPNPKKRKTFSNGSEMDDRTKRDIEQSYIIYEEDACKRARLVNTKPKVYKTLVRSENSNMTLVVKDGYQWRKYGQKVTRDNPSPRAYFKCASAPICHVKKKVQRSVDDPSILVATYEGEHNHAKPNSKDNIINQVVLGSSCTPSGIPTITLDLINHNRDLSSMDLNYQSPQTDIDSKTLQQLLAERMVSSLSRDPSFASTLAAAISGKIIQTTTS